MGRPPIGKTAMTGAERTRLYRLKLAAIKPATKPSADAAIAALQKELLQAKQDLAATKAGVRNTMAGSDRAAFQKELVQVKEELAQTKQKLAQARARVVEFEAGQGQAEAGADVAQLKADNARLKARVAGLETTVKHSMFYAQGYIMPEKQFSDLRRCLHPDVITFLEAAAKDHPTLQPKVEPLIKQFTKAAMTLTEFKDVLVNRAAEEKQKRSTAFWAAAHWKRDEELRKKEAAKREKAAAKRAAKRAAAQG